MTKKIPYVVPNIRELETLDFPALEETAGVRFGRMHRERILDLINRYLQESDMQSETPPDAEIRIRMEKVARAANDLAELLSDSSYEEQCFLAHCWPGGKTSPQQARSLLRDLEEQAKAVASAISPTRGRRRDSALTELIRGIHRVWIHSGGKGLGANYDTNTDSPSGRFLSFLRLILKEAGQDQKPAGLLKAIKKAKPLR